MAKDHTLLVFPREDQIAELVDVISEALPAGTEYSLFQNGRELFVGLTPDSAEELAGRLTEAGIKSRVEGPSAPDFPELHKSSRKVVDALHKAGGVFKEAVVSKGGSRVLKQLKDGPTAERSPEESDLPWYFGDSNRHLCWETGVQVTSGVGEGTETDVGRIDRSSVQQATAAAYADAVEKAGAAVPVDPSTVDGLPECIDPCTLIFQIQFATVEVSDTRLANITAGGEASLAVESESGASAGLEAKVEFDVDVNEVRVEIEWVVWAVCVGEGAPEEPAEDDDDDFLEGGLDPLATGATANVYGGDVPLRCPEMSDHGEVEVHSGRVESRDYYGTTTTTGPRSAREGRIRRQALDEAAEAASEQLAEFRRERRCGPPCRAEAIEISIGPVTGATRFLGGSYGAYWLDFWATCPWYVTRACERGD